ncbi:unnamed protein product [Aphanomyces euteiches]|uniref:Uncharacterized protein n=1 Tax=Aphanomyces euteiches TaxID=100861 RepID=A0A6G0XC37_9STRA|nr:hypothetical protein Ae201684_006682 [Aphanomyces euteiches]KAH9090974.1 hypothetical protein Ae201684P_006376 [Aphanomyces euteiches]KAH9136808.1 hypothetical protein AeRB84_018215 [Aphanomyces euteiches]
MRGGDGAKISKSMEAIQAHDMRLKEKPAAKLTLGVKGKLSNQEMELLRQQLAKAAAYDHVPDDKRQQRQQNIKRPPKFVKTIKSGVLDQDIPVMRASKPAKKPVAAIQHDVARLNRSEPQFVPRYTKGITQLDKDLLQDEYTKKPRQLSTVPVNLMEDAGQEVEKNVRPGKRLAPPEIPQVFLL